MTMFHLNWQSDKRSMVRSLLHYSLSHCLFAFKSESVQPIQSDCYYTHRDEIESHYVDNTKGFHLKHNWCQVTSLHFRHLAICQFFIVRFWNERKMIAMQSGSNIIQEALISQGCKLISLGAGSLTANVPCKKTLYELSWGRGIVSG